MTSSRQYTYQRETVRSFKHHNIDGEESIQGLLDVKQEALESVKEMQAQVEDRENVSQVNLEKFNTRD